MRKKLLTYFIMYMMMNICTYFAMSIGNHTLNTHLFTNLTNIWQAIMFWVTSIVWIIMSGIIYWDERIDN